MMLLARYARSGAITCLSTVCYRAVQYANHVQSCSLNQPIILQLHIQSCVCACVRASALLCFWHLIAGRSYGGRMQQQNLSWKLMKQQTSLQNYKTWTYHAYLNYKMFHCNLRNVSMLFFLSILGEETDSTCAFLIILRKRFDTLLPNCDCCCDLYTFVTNCSY